MSTPLRILLVEDSESDAGLIVRELTRNGYQVDARRIDRPDEMESALKERAWDLVLCDFSIPGFGGLAALALLRGKALDTPFIFVSGTIGEEMAVEATKNGASDYVLKGNLKRLAPSIKRALREMHSRQEQKQAEEALRRSERRFRQLAESAPVGIFETDILGSFVYVNSRWCEMTGTTVENALGDSWKESVHGEDRSVVISTWEKAIHSGEAACVEYRCMHVAGKVVWVIGKAAPVHDDAGELVGFIGTLTEITEQKQLEQARLDADVKFRQLVERSLVGIYIIRDGRFVYVNPKMTEIFGFTEAELISSPLLSFIDEQDHALVRENVQKRMGGNIEAIHYMLRGRKKDGTTIDLEAHGGKTLYQGEPAILGTLLDITERKRSEEQIREQARLLDLAQDAILVRDLNDRIEYWNNAAQELYGWTFAEIQNESMTEKQYRNIEDFISAKAETLTLGEWAGELQQIRKDGNDVIVSSRWTLLRTEEGQPRAILTINSDITDKKNLEKQFLRAQRLESIGTLASGIAHDLNNVLAPIMMAITLIRLKPIDPEFEKMLGMIDANAGRAVDVVKQLLTFARGAESRHGPLQMSHLIRDIARVSSATFPKSIQVNEVSDARLFPVAGDATQLHQVLLNLCVNARDAMPEGGTLTIAAENIVLNEAFVKGTSGARSGPHVLIRVTDTGTGIRPELMEKIFDPFFTTKEVGKGTGLGLSTVLSIVKNHHGFLQVQSELDRGTTFLVYIPATVEAVPNDQGNCRVSMPKGRGELILVVDDEPNLRTITSEILSRFGYDVIVAGEGAEAVIHFAQHLERIKLVITDLMMPVMDGVGLVRVIKRMKPDIQVIVSSGLETDIGQSAEAGELRDMGVHDFLLKPFSTEQLLVKLNHLLGANRTAT